MKFQKYETCFLTQKYNLPAYLLTHLLVAIKFQNFEAISHRSYVGKFRHFGNFSFATQIPPHTYISMLGEKTEKKTTHSYMYSIKFNDWKYKI